MTNLEAARILRDHNRWRRSRDDDDIPPQASPRMIGEAIDLAVKALEIIHEQHEAGE